MAMNWRQIETSRERRLWLGQIIVPLVTVVMMNPETRDKTVKFVSRTGAKVKNTVVDTYNKVKRKFSKKEEEDPCKECIVDCDGYIHDGNRFCKYQKYQK